MREQYPLQWPSDIPRMRAQDRIDRRQWKKTDGQVVIALDKELKAFGAFGVTLTRKDPSDLLSAKDPAVVVYFSRRQKQDFQWQEALGIANPAPSIDDVQRAYRELAKRYHTDVSRSDAEMMVLLNKHRDNALRFIRQLSGDESQFCVPCDNFNEFKWNVQAIRNTIHSFRQMERDGTSGILERAMKGFAAPQLKGEVEDGVHATVA